MNQKKPLALGIDVGGTRTKLGWVDANGRAHAHGDFPTPADEPPHVLVERCMEEADRLWQTVAPHSVQAGIGIGIPNACEATGEVIDPPHLAWGRVPLRELLLHHCDIPVVVINDANSAVLAEYYYGLHRGSPHILSVTIGTGLGSGLIAENRLISGANGLAPELGHIPILPAERPCACGRRGCLETWVSESGVLQTYHELLGGNVETETVQTAKELSARACNHDTAALAAWKKTGEKLALGLCPAILLAGPAHIVLSGGVSLAGDLLLVPTARELDLLLMHHFRGSFTLELSSLDPARAGILGAAAAFWRSEGHAPVCPDKGTSHVILSKGG